MTDRVPLKAVRTGTAVTGLAEFSLGDTTPVEHGGTGATTPAQARINLGLGNVDNTADLDKPVSTAVAAALAGKMSAGASFTKADVGLANVDNTSDLAKPISTAVAAALSALQSTTDKNQPNGYAGLGADGKLPPSVIPDLAIAQNLGHVANQTAMLALTGRPGDYCTRDDVQGTIWILTGADPSILANWMQFSYPGTPVVSVGGKTGVVTLAKADVGLPNVDNTSDSAKNSATATLTNKTLLAAGTNVVEATAGPGGTAFDFRNKIRNADFQVWERGTSITPALNSTSAYTADGWVCYQSGAALPVYKAWVSGNYRNSLSFNGAAGNTGVIVFQCIEAADSYDLYSAGAITAGIWVFSTVAKTITLTFNTANAADNFSVITSRYSQAFSHAGTGWQFLAATYTSPHADTVNGLSFDINFGACTAGVFGLAKAQLEPGSILLPFYKRPYGLELAICQRYFEVCRFIASTSLAQAYPTINFKVGKRVSPTLVVTPASGTGIAVSAFETHGFYQSAAHSVTTGVTVTASAEM